MLACWLAIVPTGSDALLARRLTISMGVALGLVTLASFGILVSRTLELDGGHWSALFTDMRVALSVTHFGHVWSWRIPALALAWIAWGLSLHQRSRWAIWLAVPALAAIALTRSETGHPADHGDFTLAVWVDGLHILAAAAWVGSIFGMSAIVFPRLLRLGQTAYVLAARVFQRLSTLSGIALAVLLACGIYNVVQQLGPVTSLWTTAYGITLSVKLALVLAMIVIGAHNRYVKLPRLLAAAGLPLRRQWLGNLLPRPLRTSNATGPMPALRSCARAVFAESVLGLAVIGATGTLVHQTPPTDATGMSMSMSAQHPAAGTGQR